MASYDRRSNIPHLKDTFPELVGMSSEEVQAFLNEKSGLSINSDLENGVAFDRWRQTLAKKGYPELWKITAADHARIAAPITKNLK